MSVDLGPELRKRIWLELDWAKAAPILAEQVLASESMAAEVKAPYLRRLAELCEFCVLDPQIAADLYGASFQADRSQLDVLPRMRRLCEALGRFDHAARTADLEFRQSKEPRFQAIAGQLWLDAGEPDRAIKPLLAADSLAPGNPHLVAALEVARREWANPERHAEKLIERAREQGAAGVISALQAARILNMLDFDDARFEEALVLCLVAQPNLPSACNLMEDLLFEHERFEELEHHFQRRAKAAPSDLLASELLLKGSSLLFRAGSGSAGSRLFSEALQRAVAGSLDAVPGALALLRAVVASGSDGRLHVMQYAETLYDQIASPDEQVGIAVFSAQIAWHAQKDYAVAQRWMNRLATHCAEHPLIVDFELAAAILDSDKVSPAQVTAQPAPEKAPSAGTQRRLPRVAIEAQLALAMEMRDRMGTRTKVNATTRNISTIGALVKCEKDLGLDQILEVTLSLPSASGLTKRRFNVKARVAKIVPGRGISLEWVDSTFDFRSAISEMPEPTP